MEKIVRKLDKYVSKDSRIISTTIIEGENNILYSSDNWDISNDLENINNLWNSENLGEIIIENIKYKVLQNSSEKLVAVNLEKKGSIIGFKDSERKIISRIEPGESAYLGLIETSRTLGELSKKKP
ncbi:MAG: hypothetical protein ACFE8E_15285, partial [Candidatus Hodarchaeota archaeon]